MPEKEIPMSMAELKKQNLRILEDLKAIRELLVLPENWIKGTAAMDSRNIVSYPTSKDAVKFCLLGAMDHVTKTDYRRTAPIMTLFLELTSTCPVIWNDKEYRHHFEVLELLDRAIQCYEGYCNPFPLEIVKEERILEDA